MEAAQAAGQLIGGVGAYEAGKFNKATADTEAIEAERAGAADELRVRDAARQAMGDQIAAQGANGFQQGTGSALDALAQSQVNAALDALTVRRQAAAQARSKRISGSIAKAQGENALVQGMMGAAATSIDWASQRSTLNAQSTPRPAGGGYAGSGTAASGYRSSFMGG
jgi:hypothetical protein